MSEEIFEGTFKHTCNRCSKSWTSGNVKPKTCAKCRSPYWNKERQR